MAILLAMVLGATLLAGAQGADCPTLPDFAFVPGKDTNTPTVATVAGTIADMAAACRLNDACIAFNSAGQTKASVSQPATWVAFSTNPCDGLYLRVDRIGVVGPQGPAGPPGEGFNPDRVRVISSYGASAGRASLGKVATPCVVGEVKLTAGKFTGGVKCDGAALIRSTYPELFQVIGTTFGGGDGSTTFNVPNMATITPSKMSYWICAKGSLPSTTSIPP